MKELVRRLELLTCRVALVASERSLPPLTSVRESKLIRRLPRVGEAGSEKTSRSKLELSFMIANFSGVNVDELSKTDDSILAPGAMVAR